MEGAVGGAPGEVSGGATPRPFGWRVGDRWLEPRNWRRLPTLGVLWIIILLGCGDWNPWKEGRNTLQDELAASRPFELRLASSGEWAPCGAGQALSESEKVEDREPGWRRSMRCAGWESQRGDLARALAAESATGVAPETGTTRGSSGGGDEARAAVRRALVETSDDARDALRRLDLSERGQEPTSDRLVDQAVFLAYLAAEVDRPDFLIEALDANTHALHLRDDHPQARFNQAVLLTRIGSLEGALRAWDRYLAIAEDREWIAEARERREEVARAVDGMAWKEAVASPRGEAGAAELELPPTDRQRRREWVEREVLPRWAETTDPREAAALLARAETVSDELADLTGDRLLVDTIRLLQTLDPTGPAAENAREAHRAFTQGLHRVETDAAGALPLLDEALILFLDLDSPFAAWAEFERGRALYYREEPADALRSLEDLRTRIEGKDYRAAEGRSLWMETLLLVSTDRLQDGLERGRRAVDLFREMGEAQNLSGTLLARGGAEEKLGGFQESWASRLEAVSLLEKVHDPRRVHTALQGLLVGAGQQGLPHAGLALWDDHLTLAGTLKDPQFLAYSFLYRAEFLIEIGAGDDEVAGSLALAEESSQRIRDPRLRERTEAHLRLNESRAWLARDPTKARALVDGSIAWYEDRDYSYYWAIAHGVRAQASGELNDLDAMEADLLAQIEAFEDSTSELSDGVLRLTLQGPARQAYDAMIAFQLRRRGDPGEALRYLEHSLQVAFARAGTGAMASSTPTVEQGQKRSATKTSFESGRFRNLLSEKLQANQAILVYRLLDDELLIWVLTGNGVDHRSVLLERRELARMVDYWVRSLRRGRPDEQVGKDLYDLLYEPIADLLEVQGSLVILPDRELARIPFDALRNPQTGRYLLQDWTIQRAPSLAFFLDTPRRVSTGAGQSIDGLLAVSGSTAEGGRYDGLPYAFPQARAIAELHGGRHLDRPTRGEFFEAVASSEVLSFAGHAITDSDHPFASRLVLADDPDRLEEIRLDELIRSSFLAPRLVVLSACDTIQPLPTSSGSTVDLAIPFLSWGTEHAVGSLWDVSDDLAHGFTRRFHLELARTRDVVEAHRATKLALLHSESDGQASSAFVLPLVVSGGP